jgi:hypothetical protein
VIPRLPYMKWYPSDWRADPRLRMCSLAARGLWIDLISYMHEGEPYGHLLIDGKAPSEPDIAALVARPLSEVRKALVELAERGVYSKTDAGTIYSRRMVRDKAKAERDRENGRGGGNPTLKATVNGGVNPQDNAPDKAHYQNPDTRTQIPDEKNFVRIGVAGVKSPKGRRPPRHGATGKGHTWVKAGTTEWDAYAADFRAAKGFDPVPDDRGGMWFKTTGEAPDVH